MNVVHFKKLMAKLGNVFILLCLLIANSGSVQIVQAATEDVIRFSVHSSNGEGNQIFDRQSQVKMMAPSTVQNPQWKILVLIYTSTDFTYSDGLGQHHVIASMSQSEIDRAVAASNKFVNTDIPALTSGNMIPLMTILQPNHPLSSLDLACGYWPNRSNVSADLDPAFDSVIVIWDDTGTDLNTGQQADLNGCGGLAISNGTGQTHSTFPIDSVVSNQRNVFKHEWGHSILAYFEAAGLSPQPTVDNHINATTTKYVHCSSGTPYILQDETDNDPIPNSIYNNESGFTHDYYSGTTAKPESPNQCLGITATAWSYGGPVTKLVTSYPNLLMNSSFEEGISSPSWWLTDAWTPSHSRFIWDTSNVHSGTRSIEIANSYSNDARWIQTVYVQPNSVYQLSGWIKTQLVSHSQEPVDAGANLSIVGGYEHTNGLFGDNNWTYVSLLFNTGSRTQVDVAARLGMYSGTTTGIAWFDDLKLELLSTPICFALTKSMNPIGNITGDPLPNCNNGAQYIDGTVVKLTANPPAGYTFSNWSGDITGSTNPAYVTMTANKSVTANFIKSGADKTGVFRPSNGALYLKHKNETGFADVQINYGIGGDYPVVGDWDGDGTVTIGIYRNSSFYLRNENTIGFADVVFPFGMPGDQPVAGDWDGDGDDTIGVYRSGTFFLRNSNDAGAPDMIFGLGIPGDVGIAGDWDGDGIDTTGVFRPSNGALYLKNTNATGFADIQINYGLPGDKPVTGDWDGDGDDTIGIYRDGAFYLRNSNTIGFADIVFALGIPGDHPIAGNWDGLP